MKEWWANVKGQKSFQAGIVIVLVFVAIIIWGSVDDLVEVDTASKDFAINLELYESVSEVTERCNQLDKRIDKDVYGCAGGRNKCHIISVLSWETLQHELRHCFEGDWHK